MLAEWIGKAALHKESTDDRNNSQSTVHR